MQTIEQILAELNNAVMLQLRQALMSNVQLAQAQNAKMHDIIELTNQGANNERHNNSNSYEYTETKKIQADEIGEPRTQPGEPGEPGDSSTQGHQDPQVETERTDIEYAGGSTETSVKDGETGIDVIPRKPGPDTIVEVNRNCNCGSKATLVSENYKAKMDDYYIGVNSNNSVTITLPNDCTNCYELIIKSEMLEPLEDRKIIITTENGAMINGKFNYTIENLNQYVRLICNGYHWHIIG